MRNLIPAAVILAVLGVAGCGTTVAPGGGAASSGADDATTTSARLDPSVGSAPADGSMPWVTPEGDVLLTCGHEPAFPQSLVDRGGVEISPELRREIVAVLDRHAKETGIDAPGPLQRASAEEISWMVLWQGQERGEDALQLLLADAGSTAFSLETDEPLTMRREDGAWTVTGWAGRCGAAPFLPPERAWVQVALPDGAEPEGTSIDVLVSERECTSGRDPEPFLDEPVMIEDEESVTVYWTSEQPREATCPVNPWVARTVELDAPLGDRELLDGSTWPATAITERDDW